MDFVGEVLAMREAQKRFFKSKSGTPEYFQALHDCTRLERIVDVKLHEFRGQAQDSAKVEQPVLELGG